MTKALAHVSKAFTREDDAPDEDLEPEPQLPPGQKNYITPAGQARLQSELKALVEVERPELVRTVAWAASNGDRSENADYIYGKRRLREIERRIRYLIKRLEIAEVVDPRDQDQDRVFFGATVAYRDAKGAEHTVSIVGTDEVGLKEDPSEGGRWSERADEAMILPPITSLFLILDHSSTRSKVLASAWHLTKPGPTTRRSAAGR